MTSCNAENERIKRRYFAYLKEARRYSEDSVDAAAKALNRFETQTRFKSFHAFHIEQAVAFKRSLAEQNGLRTGERLSKATLYSTLTACRNFFHWLAGQPGFRSRLSYSDAEYFNLSEKETRVAKARRDAPAPTMEQIGHVIATMPTDSDVRRRNRALVAFTLLTGARSAATASLRLQHVDVDQQLVFQDARHVKTKASKTFTTWFFPVGDDIRDIVIDWIRYLRTDLLFGPGDPVFPATKVAGGLNSQFAAAGLDRRGWSTGARIQVIFKAAFEEAGLPYFNPHSFRKTLVTLGERVCKTPEEFKAWSQNLGHEGVLTTFRSYGDVPRQRQAEIIRKLGHKQDPAGLDTAMEMAIEAVVRRTIQAG